MRDLLAIAKFLFLDLSRWTSRPTCFIIYNVHLYSNDHIITVIQYSWVCKQEIQLSRTGRAQLHIRGRHAPSFKGFARTDSLQAAMWNSVFYKKLSCRREAARRSMSTNSLLNYSKSYEMTPLSTACVSYSY